MPRLLAGGAATLLLVAAGFFLWKSQADAESVIPPAPAPAAAPLVTPLQPSRPEPPAATEKSREEKRFARADKDEDGRITRAELLEPRRKAFARLDADGSGSLSFEEWSVKTAEKFAKADGDRNGALSAAEYAATRPKPARKKCAC
ncbi:EF-hand domain-containing protein [Sphingomonas sp. LY54]|uniref:EF-hand domain-containing protein n=1 Tax=Sphingomonas sp. LY54 TaxID=3095343 RepID=UPI002D783EDF|nr:EF-hand domain-containing protein [Sphingomonas sp. LY54]WRP28911.1 EF-hand domain-containing protein [Sphingomonas sp. LY54]